jgi:hypothetical protein
MPLALKTDLTPFYSYRLEFGLQLTSSNFLFWYLGDDQLCYWPFLFQNWTLLEVMPKPT